MKKPLLVVFLVLLLGIALEELQHTSTTSASTITATATNPTITTLEEISESELIQKIRDAVTISYPSAESINQTQEFYLGCNVTYYSHYQYSYTYVGQTVEDVLFSIIYCPGNVSSLSLEHFTSHLSSVRTLNASEEFTSFFNTSAHHRNYSNSTMKMEEYVFKYGNYFIDAYYNEDGVYQRNLLLNQFASTVEQIIWRLRCTQNCLPTWAYVMNETSSLYDMPKLVVAVDLDSSGYLDNLVVWSNAGTLYAFNSTGDILWSRNDISDSPTEFKLDTGDLNSDGYENDIITISSDRCVNAFDSSGEVLWAYCGLSSIHSVISTDLDSDGYNDEVIAGSYDYNVYALDHSGELIWSYSTGSKVVAVQGVDLDSDGFVNEVIAVSKWTDAAIFALDHSGNLLWSYPLHQLGYITAIESITGLDFDSDGTEESICISLETGSISTILSFDSDGELLWDYSTSSDADIHLTSIDFDSDGHPNYCLAVTEENEIMAFNSSGFIWNSTTTDPMVVDMGTSPSKIRSVNPIDYDSDGYFEDFVIGTSYRIYIYNSTGGVVWMYPTGNPLWSVSAIDFDSDGYLDDLVGGSSYNIYKGKIYAFDFNATTTTSTSTTTIILLDCPIKGDLPPCDGLVSDFELLEYIDLWVLGEVGDFDLLEAIDNWAS